jgi:MoaA/NifB/PqqE/SkfB family radical SAM enzyme
VTDNCNLLCEHCIYKPNVISGKLHKREIPLETALKLIYTFRKLGAIKLSILGGEPTLYGITNEWRDLLTLIYAAKKVYNYRYVRIVTNGLLINKLLDKEEFKLLDEISFSIDGPTPEIHDKLRGIGTFKISISNLTQSIKKGYNVNITTTVTKYLIPTDGSEKWALVDKMIRFAEELGVSRINFHVIFKMGTEVDAWDQQVAINPYDWIEIYKNIRTKIANNEYKIKVRLPQHFITREEFEKNKKFYGYCPVKMGERVLIHPNGVLRVCSALLSSIHHIANYNDKKITWEEYQNETVNHKMNEYIPCTNQINLYFDNYVPLCFSFKPDQDEIVWTILRQEKSNGWLD